MPASSAQKKISSYQGPAIPMPSLHNNAVVLPTATLSLMKSATFDLGYLADDDKTFTKFVIPPTCQFKEPRTEEQMESLGKKKFADETYKKIHWVLHMYHDW